MAYWIADRGGNNIRTAWYLSLTHLRLQSWIGLLALTLLIKLAATLVATAFLGTGAADIGKNIEPYLKLSQDLGLWLGLPVTFVLAAILEEIVFRGILSRALQQTRLGFFGGAALSRALFALQHVQNGSAGQFVVFALELTFAWIRARYDSIWPGFVTHAFTNALALFVMKAMTA